eukprot:c20993_g1_i1 orf=354-8423(+)
MELTPAIFLALFLLLSVTGWLLFMFAARLAAWMVSRMIGAELRFRIGGLTCLKDISLNFKKGTLESLVIGEVRIRTCRPSLDSHGNESARTAMLQVLLYDAEAVLRKPAEQSSKKGHRHKRHLSGRGKWMILVNIAKYVTLSVVELVVQVPDWTIEVKELDLGMDSEESGLSFLGARLILTNCNIYDRDQNANSEHALSLGQRLLSVGGLGSVVDGISAPCSIEHLSINSSFGHAREQGVTVRQLDVMFGDVLLDVNEELVRKLTFSRSRKEVKVTEPSLHLKEASQQVVASANQGHFLANAPEKASLNLPRLLIKCSHKEKKHTLENEVTGVQLVCTKVQHMDDLGGSLSHLDIHMDSGEIQLLRDGDKSLVEIMRTAVIASMEIPKQTDILPQAEIDVKLGGAQCSLLTSKFEKWVDVLYSMKPKRKERDTTSNKKLSISKKGVSWTCTISAPDMGVSVHDMDGIVLYNVSLQTSHIFFNSALKQGTRIHAELGELYVYMVEEKSNLYKGLFGMDTNSGCLLQMSRVTVDLGLISSEAAIVNSTDGRKAVLTVEVTGTAVHLTLQRLQSFLLSSMGLVHHFKQYLVARRTPNLNKGSNIKNIKKRRVQEIKLCIEGISIQYCAQMHILDTTVPDPKKVNFGCEGGEVIMEENNDGKLRTATVKVAKFRSFEGTCLMCKSTLEIAHLQLQIDYNKNDIQLNLQRLKMVYQELESETRPICEVLIAALQSGKLMYRMAPVGSGVPGCLICISDLKGRWEPDIHLFFLDAFLRLKSYFRKKKQLFYSEKVMENSSTNLPLNSSEGAEGSSKSKSVGKGVVVAVAVDLEHIDLSAALADGVDASLSIASMFSEDLKVGILLEELKVLLNGAAVLKSKRLQIARIPCFIQNNVETTVAQESSICGTETASFWDYLIQGSGVRIVLPYRLECRAIDDAVEDMWRGLKIAMLAQKISIDGSSLTNPNSKKKPVGLPSTVGGVKFVFESITAEVEEEPLQGWFDEHHQLLIKQRLELDVRERLLDEFISEEGSMLDGKESDLKKELQQQASEAYKRECIKLQPYESSGSFRSSFQSGFRPSVNRGSLFSIRASNLEVTLLDIEGGRLGMIEQIRKLDCVPLETEIPYSRILGKRVNISTSSLSVHLRNYTLPMLSAAGGKCNGQLIFARQATCFPSQVLQELYVGRWRKLIMFRSESGTTPPFKMFSDLPIEFDKAEAAFGVGFEPALADLTFAFTVALRKADLSVHDLRENPLEGVDFYGVRSSVKTSNLASQPAKKERSLPWWDDMRYYLHGKNSIVSTDFKLLFLATTNPYEERDAMKIEAGSMDIQQGEGNLSFFAKDFKLSISSLETLMAYQGSKPSPAKQSQGSIQSPFFKLDITMDWDCETGNPLFHYLHAFPHELVTREKVYDPFRSTSLILRWNFRLADAASIEGSTGMSTDSGRTSQRLRPLNLCRSPAHKSTNDAASLSSHARAENFSDVPTMSLGGHDLIWIFRWWSTLYSPPHKLRTFSKWPRFGLIRVPRSGNLSLDKVLTDFMLRVDSTPAQIKHISLVSDDPAKGLTFGMKKFKYELCYSRGKQRYTFDCKRDILELVYQGLDLHMLRADLKNELGSRGKLKCDGVESGLPGSTDDPLYDTSLLIKSTENGFFFTTDYFSLRKQAPKADLSRLSLWQEEARRPSNTKTMDFTHGSGSDPTRSDPSDDDGFNIVLPDNCLHVSLYGLKLLWAIYTRDAVWAWVENLYKAFEAPKPSPSRQYAQRKIIEEQSKLAELESGAMEGSSFGSSTQCTKGPSSSPSPSRQDVPLLHSSPIMNIANAAGDVGPMEQDETEEEGTMHFMVNVVQPQFNLQSEEARGRFLLAAASGRVMARSFRSIINIRPEMIAQALRSGGDHLSGNIPELTWSRRELSVILEQVQAHVAPTDVDPGAGLQWLPKVPRGSQKVKRTGALLERVFMPCAMYFQYTRCKSETSDIKVKALKELSFNSSNITAIMTSRQFQVMVDIISNLLLARLPKPRKYFSLHGGDEEDDIEEETDEVVPDGVPEVELARIKLEETERELKLLSADLKTVNKDNCDFNTTETDQDMKPWMMHCGKRTLVLRLNEDWSRKLKSRKVAARSLRIALQRAAQQRFKEKEKTKSIPSAMRISWAIDKIVWSMLSDGQTFAEAEISNMNLNVDRDFHEVGIAQLTAKHFVVKNCLPHAKSSTVLSAWNPPSEWGRNVMLRVDAKQGAPKEGNSPLELFEVAIFPLRIHLTERMYRMMWDYFFPKEDRDTQRRQVWKASTTPAVKRGKKITSGTNELLYSSASKREQMPAKSSTIVPSFLPTNIHPHSKGEEWQGVDFRLTAQILEKDMKIVSTRGAKVSTLQRSLSYDATKEDNPDDPVKIDSLQKTDTTLAVSLTRKVHCAQTEQGENSQHNLLATISANENSLLKLRDSSRGNKSHKLPRDDKKLVKSSSQDEKRSTGLNHTNLEFHNIKISQVELLVTYEGSRLSVNDLRLLMDTFTRVEFTGTWRRFFSRVKKHIIWSVLKSVAGMQGKKFKDKLQAQGQVEGGGYPGDESSSSDSDGSNAGVYEQFFPSKFKRPRDRAGEGFVSSIRGLFNSQRRKAKAVVLRTKRADSEATEGGWTEGEAESAPFTRQLSISKAKRLLRRHTKKFLSSTRHRGSILFKEQSQGSPLNQSEASSDASSCYEEIELVDP